MKNFYTIFFVLLISTIGYTQVVNIPDVNFRNYLILNFNINTNHDNDIQVSEANSYASTLNVSGLNISDLTGIEYFINIPTLNCSSNNLTTLSLVNNTALTSLICFSNQLTSLDITYNNLLNNLSVGDNNLTNLNTVNKTNLETLNCSDNSISSLDLSDNINLQSLTCRNTNLSNLDLSVNTALTFLNCSNNSFTSLDLSSNTALTDLRCDNNSLVQIDLSYNPALDLLYCDNNNLLNIDITNNTLITKIKCNNNDLRVLYYKNGNNDAIYEMDATSNPDLTCIEVDDAVLANSGQGSAYTQWNIPATASYSDNCSPCEVTIPDTAFKSYLIGNLNINTNGDSQIQCDEASNFTGGIDINNLGVSDLTGLEAFTALTQLNCSNNNLNSLDVSANTALTNLVCRNNTIETLDLSNHPNLVMFRAFNNNLTYLNLKNGNNVILTDVNTNSNPTLTCIEVDDPTNANAGNGVYASWIIDANSSYSDICSTCIVTIPDANFKNYLLNNAAINTNSDTEIQCLEAQNYTGTLSLSGLGISDLTGLEAFVNSTALYCQNNNLSVLDVTANTQLLQLACWGNSITSLDVSHAIGLTDLLCGNNLIESLDISNNTNLTTLNCSTNKLGNLNLKNAANAILTSMDATNNETLTCIAVDNATDATAGNGSYAAWQIDATANYSEDCAACVVYFADSLLKNILVADANINTNGDAEIQCNEASSYTGEVDISFVNLPDLTGIETFTSMTSLNCQNTNITALNLPDSNNLVELNCRDNFLTTVDVSDKTALTYLNCSNNNLSGIDVSNNVLLSKLHVSENNLGSIDLTNNPALTELTCIDVNITTLDVSNNPLLTHLNCPDNPISSIDVTGFSDLQILDIHNTNVSSIDVSTNASLVSLECSNTNIATVDLSNNPLLTRFIGTQLNSLTSLNLKNGNNSILTVMHATDCPNLLCIEIDDETLATGGSGVYAYWQIDATASYSEDCTAFLAVDDFKDTQFRLFPNPTDGVIQLQAIDSGIYQLSDSRGRYVKKGVITAGESRIDMRTFPQGIYFLTLEFNSYKTTEKIIKY